MTTQFHSRMCGKLLGDGSIVKQEGRQPRFKFQHCKRDYAWTKACYEGLRNAIPLTPPKYVRYEDPRVQKGYTETYYVQSKTSETITTLYHLWYPNGKKRLPISYIAQYLNAEALAWWYQDDGHLKIENGFVTKVILSTDDFSPEENHQLIDLLYNKFSLRFQRDGQNRLLLYDQFQIIYFLHLVTPWLNEAMQQKAMPVQPLRPIAKRTTIYLPETTKLTKPTAEINNALENLKHLFNDDGKTLCISTIYNTFSPMLETKTPTKSYQIVIREDYREMLAVIRQWTGLSVSLVVGWCFINEI